MVEVNTYVNIKSCINKRIALSDFPNVEAKREEQRNCLKHLVGRIDVFRILPTGFGKSLIFQLFPRIKCALEWMSFTLVVVTPLIAIMKDQVKHLNEIRVAAAMIGEDVDEAVKRGPQGKWTQYTEVPNRVERTSRRKAWKSSCSYRYWRAPLYHRMVYKFSLQLLCVFIAWVNDLYWNGFLSKWAVFVCHLNHNSFVTYKLKSCFKAVNKFIVHEYFFRSLLSESLTLGF